MSPLLACLAWLSVLPGPDALPIHMAVCQLDATLEEQAILASLAYHESRNTLDVVGRDQPTLGPWQTHPAWGEPTAALALTLVRRSLSLCRALPPLDRLAWYTHGHDCSGGHQASRIRLQTARQLLHR